MKGKGFAQFLWRRMHGSERGEIKRVREKAATAVVVAWRSELDGWYNCSDQWRKEVLEALGCAVDSRAAMVVAPSWPCGSRRMKEEEKKRKEIERRKEGRGLYAKKMRGRKEEVDGMRGS
jgi:uncharacterized protein YbbK (DUF523 family)